MHSEYDVKWAGSFEPCELIRKVILLSGMMFVPQHYPFLRVMLGTIISVITMLLMCILRLYKTQENIIIGIMIQLTLVLFFIANGWAILYAGFEGIGVPHQHVKKLMIFSSAPVMLSMASSLIGTLWFVGISYLVYNAMAREKPRTIRLKETGLPPELTLSKSHRWHLFLSHIWSSGQDQVAVIKRQLQMLLPDCQVFLDVDDLDDISKLEKYISQTAVIMIFLSHNYFQSKNCLRELNETMSQRKPICSVREGDPNKGGITLELARQECPEEHREHIFKRPPIMWHRVSDYQLASLKRIALSMLVNTPKYANSKNLNVFVPGELDHTILKLDPAERVVLGTSTLNAGAREAARELKAHFPQVAMGKEVTEKLVKKLDRKRRSQGGGMEAPSLTESYAENSSSGELPSPARLPKPGGFLGDTPFRKVAAGVRAAGETVMRTADALGLDGSVGYDGTFEQDGMGAGAQNRYGDNVPTHFVLYLNTDTFTGEDGEKLAELVRKVRAVNMNVLMLHERVTSKGGCDFEHFFRTTPKDLIDNGLYSQAPPHPAQPTHTHAPLPPHISNPRSRQPPRERLLSLTRG